jgi:hypothetical protein
LFIFLWWLIVFCYYVFVVIGIVAAVGSYLSFRTKQKWFFNNYLRREACYAYVLLNYLFENGFKTRIYLIDIDIKIKEEKPKNKLKQLFKSILDYYCYFKVIIMYALNII